MEFSQVIHIYNDLYSNVDGYKLSIIGRERLRLNSHSLTYGETTLESLAQIFKLVLFRKEGVFYDLGSGTGKTIFSAALLRNFKKLVGIELVDELHEKAEELLDFYKQKYLPKLASKENQEIKFVRGNIFDYDYSDADVIYASTTCFSEDDLLRLAKTLSNVKPGTIIITMSCTLPGSNYRIYNHKKLKMGWGQASIIVSQKV